MADCRRSRVRQPASRRGNPEWIHKQEMVVVTGTSIRSSVFGFIRFKEIASYQVHPLAYPPRIKLKLRDGRTVRFVLRPKPMTFGPYDESEIWRL